MSAFSICQDVEARAWAIVGPFIRANYSEDLLAISPNSPMGMALQKSFGDFISVSRKGTLMTFEFKAEETFTGNLFLETWSNKNLLDPTSHAGRGMTPGWMISSRADWLFYYFISVDRLYVINMLALKRWAWGHNGKQPCLWKRQERPQSKYQQINDTHGAIVKIDDLMNELSPSPSVYAPRACGFGSNENIAVI